MKGKDFNTSFDKLKDFKSKYPKATDEDEFFKALYSRLRKYVKKLNRIKEIEDKIQGGAEPTAEQRDLLSKKKELEQSLKELVEINAEYVKNFDNHCQQIWSHKQSLDEQVKQDEVKEETPNEDAESEPEEDKAEPQQPAVDVDAVRNEGYQRGFEDGRQSVSQEVAAEALSQGRSQGFFDAKQQFDIQTQDIVNDAVRRTSDYCSMFVIMGFRIDSYMPLDPPFVRGEYFTDEESVALNQLFMMCQMFSQKINFKEMIDGSSDRIKRLVNKDSQLVPGCRNVTYKQLSDAIDRALENPKFVNTLHQLVPMDNSLMNAFGGCMPGSMMGMSSPVGMYPMMYSSQQTPHRVPAPQAQVPHEEAPVFSQPEEQKIEQLIISESQPVEEPQVEENTLQEPEHETNAQIESIWHQIDDDDDDEPDHDQEHDDDNDNRSQEEHPAGQEPQTIEENKQPIEQAFDEAAPAEVEKDVEEEGAHRHQTRGYQRGQRRGQYRRGHHYDRHDNEEYRGRPYNRGQRRPQRYRYRGGRDNRGYDNSYSGYHRGYGGYENEGGQNWNQNKKGKPEKQEETVDNDGFFIVGKKGF